MSTNTTWPDDSDGDVLRRMKSGGFDFESFCLIDFNIDFKSWPIPLGAMKYLEEKYSMLNAYPLEVGGYVQIKIHSLLSYELVIAMQRELTENMAAFGGICDSWAVLH